MWARIYRPVKDYGKQRHSITGSYFQHYIEVNSQLQALTSLTLRKEPLSPVTFGENTGRNLGSVCGEEKKELLLSGEFNWIIPPLHAHTYYVYAYSVCLYCPFRSHIC
jgi:hypothetical protein